MQVLPQLDLFVFLVAKKVSIEEIVNAFEA
jgi:hypothetical protein